MTCQYRPYDVNLTLMRKTIAVFLCAALVLAFDAGSWAISWEHDLAGALKKAKADGKPVMADFYTDWCHWCKKLDDEVYSDAGLNRIAKQFVCVKVNCEADKNAPAKYNVRGYPTIIFFDPNGNAADTFVGYRDVPAFLNTMKKLSGKETVPGDAKPGKQVGERAAAGEKVHDGKFRLAGIMGEKAIVNDQVVGKGDKVDNADVVEITGDHVKLRYQDEDITLKI